MNISFCFVAFVLIISSVYLAIMRQDKQIFFDFQKLLNPEQIEKYHKMGSRTSKIKFNRIILDGFDPKNTIPTSIHVRSLIFSFIFADFRQFPKTTQNINKKTFSQNRQKNILNRSKNQKLDFFPQTCCAARGFYVTKKRIRSMICTRVVFPWPPEAVFPWPPASARKLKFTKTQKCSRTGSPWLGFHF